MTLGELLKLYDNRKSHTTIIDENKCKVVLRCITGDLADNYDNWYTEVLNAEVIGFGLHGKEDPELTVGIIMQ